MLQSLVSAEGSVENINQAREGVTGFGCIQGSIAQLSQQDLENIFGRSQYGLDLAGTLNSYVEKQAIAYQ